ncbi:MAG: c-type cytochrome [Alphaproteobacteria bacterium]|nr:c-type cytochrome [Alphaproteobacteria bacterium]
MRRAILLWAVACLGLGLGRATADEITLPDGPGRDLVYARCQTCHDLGYLKESSGIPASAWKDILVTMYGFGLRIPDAEKAQIATYLGTYLGPNPPPAAPAVSTADAAPSLEGGKLFEQNCSACHQKTGKGVPASFPPLAGNSDLFLDRLYPVHVVLHGLTGKIAVGGKTFNGTMPSFAHLDDARLAAILNYVRGAWGNTANAPAGMSPLAAADVKGLREQKQTPKEVHGLRASLLK